MSRSSSVLVVACCLLAALAVLPGAAHAASKPAVAPKGACTEKRGGQLVAVFDVKVAGKGGATASAGAE